MPDNIGTGFAQVWAWQLAKGLHPVIGAWFGSHFQEKKWMPTVLLAYMVETGLLNKLEIAEAIVAFEKQTEVWLPDSRDQACSAIGKFTQRAKADGKRLTCRLITDQGELDFLVRDMCQSGTLVSAPAKCPAGWILTYYDGSQAQYAHLRASMLAYAHIDLLEMLRRFTPTEAIRVVTDSLYVKKTALHKLEGIVAYVPHDQHPKWYCTTCLGCHDGPTSRPPNKENVAPAKWRDKGETIYSAEDHAAYEPEPEHWGASNDVPETTAPSHTDPLTRHVLSYLNGGGGSNKTTRTINLFQARNPLVFTPTHRLAKEMRTRGWRPRHTTPSSAGVDKLSGRRTAWVRSTSRVWSSGMRCGRSPGPCLRPSSTGSTRGEFRWSAVGTKDSHLQSQGSPSMIGSVRRSTTTKRRPWIITASSTSSGHWRKPFGCSRTRFSAGRCARLYPSVRDGTGSSMSGTPATLYWSPVRPQVTEPRSCSLSTTRKLSPTNNFHCSTALGTHADRPSWWQSLGLC